MELSDLNLECLRLAQSLSARIDEIDARDFPVALPRDILGQYKRLISLLTDKKIPSIDDEITLKLLANFFRDFSTTLTLVENATSSEIPLGLPEVLEDQISKIAPGSKILICPLLDMYNYSVNDLSQYFRDALDPLLDQNEARDLFGDESKRYFVASFPLMERENFLLHCVFFHELGHLIADQHVAEEGDKRLSEKILMMIEKEKARYSDLGEIFGEKSDPLFKAHLRRAVLDRIQELRNGLLGEVISDLAAVHVCGPAGLISLVHLAFADDPDQIPGPGDVHPPWRFRFREAYAELKHLGYIDAIRELPGRFPLDYIKDAALKFLEDIEIFAARDDDKKRIATDFHVKIATDLVHEVLQSAKEFVRNKLRDRRYTADLLKRECPELATRLAFGVPPNEMNPGAPADFRSALNAGWFYKLSKLAVPAEGGKEATLLDLSRLNRLVQKGIELATVQKEYETFGF